MGVGTQALFLSKRDQCRSPKIHSKTFMSAISHRDEQVIDVIEGTRHDMCLQVIA
jgi:hypothetical protein